MEKSGSLTRKDDFSNVSLISSSGSSNQNYSSCIDQTFSIQNSTNQFDIIDSLDYDDIDDHIMNQELFHQQRESFVKEIHNINTNYVQLLESTIHNYLLPLRKHSSKSSKFLNLKKTSCSDKDVFALFANIENIYAFQRKHLHELDERFNMWGPTQIISDVVLSLFLELQPLYQIYLNNYDAMLTTVDKLSRSQIFTKIIDNLNHNTPLLPSLRIPVTYIKHYQKLVNQLHEKTSSMHPDYNGLSQCKAKFKQYMKESKSLFDDIKSVDQVYQLLNNMGGHPFSMKINRRLLLKNYQLTYVSNQAITEERAFFLFNDILVFAKQDPITGLRYKGHLILFRAQVRAVNTYSNWDIEILSPFHSTNSPSAAFIGEPAVHVIRLNTKEEQLDWLASLKFAIDHYDQPPKKVKSRS